MSNFYTHLCLFLILLMVTFFSFLLSVWVTIKSPIYLSFYFLRTSSLPLSLSLFFDLYSCWFMTAVLLISSVIIIYSFFYISPYRKSIYFLVLTLIFIISIILVICFSNLIFIILGWDGLGLVSFFLIVYYQNPSSVFSGMFTLLINRVGDAFFLCSIVLYSYYCFDYYVFSSIVPTFLTAVLLIVTFITKRAIFPFSPWLPIAIAAPTPISALVHSSTLVTSGLFLIIKYSYIFYSSSVLIEVLLVLCIFTSFYAGINTIFEKDLKKLIALSTLRHLGFIGIAFSLGLLNLSFFHLLTHALFKSVLFISMGEVIINLSHSQDMRYLSQGSTYTPFSCFIMNISILNLLGFPSLSGFWSKDLILESINYTDCRYALYYLSLLNLFFTFYYSFQLFYYSFQLSKTSPYLLFHPIVLLHAFLVSLLSCCSLFFGYIFISLFLTAVYPIVPLAHKLYPLVLIVMTFFYLILNKTLPTVNSQFASIYFSSMIFLYFFITKSSSNFYYNLSFWFSKTLELGAFNSSLNLKLPEALYYVSYALLKHSTYTPFSIVLSSLSLVFIMTYLF